MKRTFLEKFFSASQTAAIRKEICGIRQHTRETLHEYWQRFNHLCATCPHNHIGEKLLIQYFYEGLILIDRSMIDAAITHNNSELGEPSLTNKVVNEVGSVGNLRMKNQLTSLVRQLAVNQHQKIPQVKVCGICTSVEHLIDMCPTLQETESAATMMPEQNNAPSMEEWMKFQQNMNATMHDLKMQIGQLANLVSQLQSAGSRNLPLQPITNPKGGNVSTVTLRSGRELHIAPRPKSTPTKVKTKKEANTRARPTALPFPSRTNSAKKPETDEDLMKMFQRVEINILLLDAIKQIPKYAKFLKELCVHKRNKLKGGVEVGGVLLAFIQNDNTKYKDPEIFSVPCTIGRCTFADAMLDLRASINVIPASEYKSLNFGNLEPIGVVIQLAN
ncbi:hypothetical protein CR513_45645, partial [Mucuna pruriens]